MSAELIRSEEWAAARGLSARSARRYAGAGLIPGATRTAGGRWLIPADAPAPDTTPEHMRPAPRVITGEVIGADDRADVPTHLPTHVPTDVATRGPGRGEVVPAAARYTPEAPLFYTAAEVAAMAGPRVGIGTVRAMLDAGEIFGYRGRLNGGGWLIPASEIKRLRGDHR